MDVIEFQTDHSTGEAMYKIIGQSSCHELTPKDTDLIKRLLDISETFYPDQYEALCKEYEKSSCNKPYYDFLRARRIINCNFGVNDSKVDLDHMNQMNFELVKCPRKAECKYFKIICQPTFNSKLSDRELELMRLYYENVSTEEIAERLFISIHTVNNHRKNSLTKLGLNSLLEFVTYANKNNLF